VKLGQFQVRDWQGFTEHLSVEYIGCNRCVRDYNGRKCRCDNRVQPALVLLCTRRYRQDQATVLEAIVDSYTGLDVKHAPRACFTSIHEQGHDRAG
jgi:hypothetical protein